MCVWSVCFPCASTVRYCLLSHSGSGCISVVVLGRLLRLKSRGREGLKRERKKEGKGLWVKGATGVGGGREELLSQSQPVLLSVLDAPDGLDLGGLTVGAPVPPVLVVSAVSLTLHDVLLAPVARVLVAHKAAGWMEKAAKVSGTILGAA